MIGAMPSTRLVALRRSLEPVMRFVAQYHAEPIGPDGADMTFGNPTEMPLSGLVDALVRSAEPKRVDWYAYKGSEREAREPIAASLRQRLGIDFDPDDIAVTNGGFAAISVALHALLDPGDEVIFLSPPWFFYEMLIAGAGGTPVRVRLEAPDFELDAARIEAAITSRTRAVIVNSPNNPTGRVYSPERARALARVLEAASARNGRTIHLLSDEAYHRIVFDGRTFESPIEPYPHSLLLYSYGKTLLAPGQRVGFVAIHPAMPDREAVREAVAFAQWVTGYAFANALLQHALADLEKVSIDVGAIERRRDRMMARLRELGYELSPPEGTFYLLVRCPIADDVRFWERLRARNASVLPGSIVELPGWFRISLTANDAMIERGLDALARVSDEIA